MVYFTDRVISKLGFELIICGSISLQKKVLILMYIHSYVIVSLHHKYYNLLLVPTV